MLTSVLFDRLGRRSIQADGGFRYRHHIGQPEAKTDATAVPRNIGVPILQGLGLRVVPLVREGAGVLVGQTIWRDDSTVSLPVDLRMHSAAGGHQAVDRLTFIT